MGRGALTSLKQPRALSCWPRRLRIVPSVMRLPKETMGKSSSAMAALRRRCQATLIGQHPLPVSCPAPEVTNRAPGGDHVGWRGRGQPPSRSGPGCRWALTVPLSRPDPTPWGSVLPPAFPKPCDAAQYSLGASAAAEHRGRTGSSAPAGNGLCVPQGSHRLPATVGY